MFILVSSTRLQNAPSGDWKVIRRQQAWLMTPFVIVCFREKISDAHTHTHSLNELSQQSTAINCLTLHKRL